METAALAFLGGVLLLMRCSTLPSLMWSAVVLSGLGLLLIYNGLALSGLSRRRLPRLGRNFANALFFLGVGFVWALVSAHLFKPAPFNPLWEGRDLQVTGVIVDLPEVLPRRTKFVLQLETLQVAEQNLPIDGKVSLSWYDTAPRLVPGDRWILTVKLKRPSGFRNPGSFDYEAWLYQQSIIATGHVRAGSADAKPAGRASWTGALDRGREQLSNFLTRSLSGDSQVKHLGLIKALVLADRRGISADDWRTFSLAGISHLIAISGLHISLLAGLLYFLTQYLWSRSYALTLRVPAAKPAAAVAILGATAYSLLAGMGIPTQRALIMVLVMGVYVWRQQPHSSVRLLALSLVGVLTWDPFAVLAAGFWLSFGAVALLLLMAHTFRGTGKLKSAVRMNGWMALFMLPLSLYLLGKGSWVSPLANLIAIPVYDLLVVPLVLVGLLLLAISPTLGYFAYAAAGELIDWVYLPIRLLATLNSSYAWLPIPGTGAAVSALLGMALLILPRVMPLKWMGLVFLLPWWVGTASGKDGEAELTVLDVGQGLAVVIKTKNHALVYDVGPRVSERLDTGESVVLPYLMARHIRRPDLLIVSHADQDHSGGLASVLRAFPATRVLSGEVARLAVPGAQACRTGQKWIWDAVVFEIVHPVNDAAAKSNNRSCVLKVSAGKARVLLTGDIERVVEAELVTRYSSGLNAEVLLVPHHGSRTSSSAEFVRAVNPEFAVVSAGYRNRYRHPAADVVKLYRELDVTTLSTVHDGAIRFKLSPMKGVVVEERFRVATKRFWHRE